MANSNQLTPGMVLSINEGLYRVESVVKVTVARGQPFIKTKLRNIASDEVLEKNFKLNQSVNDVSLIERKLEFLYLEGSNYLFLDSGTLDQVMISPNIVGDNVDFLKEGVELQATFYGDTIFTVELPQFLELMVSKTDPGGADAAVANATKKAVLETGAVIEVPRFIESGDIIKVDTRNKEYIQRV